MNNREMTVNIFTINEGLVTYSDIKLIRIKSVDYNLLIMKDYMPIIGEIKGNISINGINENKKMNNIEAFYMSKDNEFNLIITKDNNDRSS